MSTTTSEIGKILTPCNDAHGEATKNIIGTVIIGVGYGRDFRYLLQGRVVAVLGDQTRLSHLTKTVPASANTEDVLTALVTKLQSDVSPHVTKDQLHFLGTVDSRPENSAPPATSKVFFLHTDREMLRKDTTFDVFRSVREIRDGGGIPCMPVTQKCIKQFNADIVKSIEAKQRQNDPKRRHTR